MINIKTMKNIVASNIFLNIYYYLLPILKNRLRYLNQSNTYVNLITPKVTNPILIYLSMKFKEVPGAPPL